MTDKTRHVYEFEGFRLDARNPSLWRGDELVPIPPKALETLILLVESGGEIVSRERLLEAVWKDIFVEEGNINYTISLLRKTLSNKDLIQTIPRRGYRFTAAIKEITPNGKVLLQAEPPSAIEKTPKRWIFVSILLVSLVFLTSFAFWWRNEKPTEPPVQASEAMQAYTRGKMILNKKNVENREEKAIDEFQNAIRLDPTLAVAYVGLAEGFSASAVRESFPNSVDFYAKAKTAAEKSLELDPNLAEGYLVRGWIRRQADWDWSGAEADLRHAIQLNSKHAPSHQRLALLLCSLGRQDEALSEIKIAYELDPIADYIIGARFPILEARREYDTALKESEQFLRENKTNPAAARAYATFLYHKQNYPQVIELCEKMFPKDTPRNAFAWLSLLHASYYKTGQFDKADESLKKLEQIALNDTKTLYSLAMNYAELNRADEAVAALRKCLEMHEERMVWLGVEPRFANLRNDPRFQDLVRKMRFS